VEIFRRSEIADRRGMCIHFLFVVPTIQQWRPLFPPEISYEYAREHDVGCGGVE
jgi:hypothetical protein